MTKTIKTNNSSRIVLKKKVNKNVTVIEGFPGIGFVGTIAARYIVEELGMELVGHLESDKIPSVVIVHNSVPCSPIRIYAKDDLVVILSELIIPHQFTYELSKILVKWFKEIEAKEVVSMAGTSSESAPLKIIQGQPLKTARRTVSGITTSAELNNKLTELGVKIITEGTLAGTSSNVLLNCIEHDIPAAILMVEANFVPDPLAAAPVLEVLNKHLKLGVNVKKLIEHGKKVEGQFKLIFEQLEKEKRKNKDMTMPSPMYG